MATTGNGTRFIYRLENTWGLPQCGCEVIDFGEWYELEEYIDNNPDVEELIHEGYARISEVFSN